MINLNTKERMLLQDEKSHEELCIQKYQDYANKACDPELSSLFTQPSQKEQQHLNTINQILSGTVPNVQQSGGQGQQGGQNQQSQQSNLSSNMSNSTPQTQTASNLDKFLCQDSLSTEKYVSPTYDTTIFEFRDKNIRNVLNHIQKEEQEHGEQIYNYMHQHGMY